MPFSNHFACFAGAAIGAAIVGRIAAIISRNAYRRGVRDGMAKKLYAAYQEYSEQHRQHKE